MLGFPRVVAPLVVATALTSVVLVPAGSAREGTPVPAVDNTIVFGGEDQDSVFDIDVYDGVVTVVGRAGEPEGGGAGRSEAYIASFDSRLEHVTTRRVGPPAQDATVVGVDSGPWGQVVVGYTSADIGLQPTSGYYEFVRRYDRRGRVVWTAQVGGPWRGAAADVVVADGTVYVAGSRDTDDRSRQLHLATFDLTNGTAGRSRTWGGAGLDMLFEIAVTGDLLVVSGAVSGAPIGEQPGGTHGAVIGLDRRRLTDRWVRLVGDSSTGGAVNALAITRDAVFIAGHASQGGFVARLDLDGRTRWVVGEQGPDDGSAVVADIVATPTGLAVVGEVWGRLGTTTGSYDHSDAFVRGMSSATGDVTWTVRRGTAEAEDYYATAAMLGDRVVVAGAVGAGLPDGMWAVTVSDVEVTTIGHRATDVLVRGTRSYADRGAVAVTRGATASTRVRVLNAGTFADQVAVAWCRPPAGLRLRVTHGGRDVTREVVAGTFRTPRLDPGRSVTLRVDVTAARGAEVGRTACRVRTWSTARPSATDRASLAIGVAR